METVTDREAIPKLDENELIRLDETRLETLAARVAAVVGVVGAAALGWFGLEANAFIELEGEPGLVLLGAALLAAAALISWSVVAAADIRARGLATAANLELRARASVTVAAPGEAGTTAGLWAHIIGRETGDKHLVVDTRIDHPVRGHEDYDMAVDGMVIYYLLARNDEKPTWYRMDKIDGWEVKTADESVDA